METPDGVDRLTEELAAPPEVVLKEVSSFDDEAFVRTRGPSISPFRASMQRFLRDRRAVISLLTILGILFLSFAFPPLYRSIGQPLHEQVAPEYVVTIPAVQYHSAEYQDAKRIIQYPSALHWLGTDDNGQDILARLLQGWQVSLLVVIAIEVQDVLFGVFFGVLAGYFGGALDVFLSRFTDLMFAFPGVLFAILVTAIFGPLFDNISILGVRFGPYGRAVLGCIVLGILVWPLTARYIRAQTLQLKEQPFIEAARASGASHLKIIMRHILPNMGGLLIVVTTLNLAGNVGADATLSFLGLGVQPPGSGLGLMISQYAPYLQVYGYEMIWPLLGVVVLVLACSFVGDGLEAAFDPRNKDYGL
jgi:ABC-type dipeptide/oligopeptide/nickel transport system permease subunit